MGTRLDREGFTIENTELDRMGLRKRHRYIKRRVKSIEIDQRNPSLVSLVPSRCLSLVSCSEKKSASHDSAAKALLIFV
jgi:hypothetical protein